KAGGTVEIYSAPGSGTTVFIILPGAAQMHRTHIGMPLDEYLKHYGGEQLIIDGKEFIFSKVKKLKMPSKRARRVIEYLPAAARSNKFVLVEGTPKRIKKCYFYEGPAIAIHGHTYNGDLAAAKVPLSEIIRVVSEKEKIKHLLVIACNHQNGTLKNAVIPSVYATRNIKRSNKRYLRFVTVVDEKGREKVIEIKDNLYVCFCSGKWKTTLGGERFLQPVSAYELKSRASSAALGIEQYNKQTQELFDASFKELAYMGEDNFCNLPKLLNEIKGRGIASSASSSNSKDESGLDIDRWLDEDEAREEELKLARERFTNYVVAMPKVKNYDPLVFLNGKLGEIHKYLAERPNADAQKVVDLLKRIYAKDGEPVVIGNPETKFTNYRAKCEIAIIQWNKDKNPYCEKGVFKIPGQQNLVPFFTHTVDRPAGPHQGYLLVTFYIPRIIWETGLRDKPNSLFRVVSGWVLSQFSTLNMDVVPKIGIQQQGSSSVTLASHKDTHDLRNGQAPIFKVAVIKASETKINSHSGYALDCLVKALQEKLLGQARLIIHEYCLADLIHQIPTPATLQDLSGLKDAVQKFFNSDLILVGTPIKNFTPSILLQAFFQKMRHLLIKLDQNGSVLSRNWNGHNVAVVLTGRSGIWKYNLLNRFIFFAHFNLLFDYWGARHNNNILRVLFSPQNRVVKRFIPSCQAATFEQRKEEINNSMAKFADKFSKLFTSKHCPLIANKRLRRDLGVTSSVAGRGPLLPQPFDFAHDASQSYLYIGKKSFNATPAKQARFLSLPVFPANFEQFSEWCKAGAVQKLFMYLVNDFQNLPAGEQRQYLKTIVAGLSDREGVAGKEDKFLELISKLQKVKRHSIGFEAYSQLQKTIKCLKSLKISSIRLKAKPGDIILFRNGKFFSIGYLIRRITKSPVSHGALYLGNGWIVHAVSKGVTKEKLTGYLRSIGYLENKNTSLTVVRLRKEAFSSEEEFTKAIKTALIRAEQYVGKIYNWGAIIGFIWGVFWRGFLRIAGLAWVAYVKNIFKWRMSFYCFELISECFNGTSTKVAKSFFAGEIYQDNPTGKDILKSNWINYVIGRWYPLISIKAASTRAPPVSSSSANGHLRKKVLEALIVVLRNDVESKYLVSLKVVCADHLVGKGRIAALNSLRRWLKYNKGPAVTHKRDISEYCDCLNNSKGKEILKNLYFVISEDESEIEGYVDLAIGSHRYGVVEIAPWNRIGGNAVRRYKGLGSELRNLGIKMLELEMGEVLYNEQNIGRAFTLGFRDRHAGVDIFDYEDPNPNKAIKAFSTQQRVKRESLLAQYPFKTSSHTAASIRTRKSLSKVHSSSSANRGDTHKSAVTVSYSEKIIGKYRVLVPETIDLGLWPNDDRMRRAISLQRMWYVNIDRTRTVDRGLAENKLGYRVKAGGLFIGSVTITVNPEREIKPAFFTVAGIDFTPNTDFNNFVTKPGYDFDCWLTEVITSKKINFPIQGITEKQLNQYAAAAFERKYNGVKRPVRVTVMKDYCFNGSSLVDALVRIFVVFSEVNQHSIADATIKVPSSLSAQEVAQRIGGALPEEVSGNGGTINRILLQMQGKSRLGSSASSFLRQRVNSEKAKRIIMKSESLRSPKGFTFKDYYFRYQELAVLIGYDQLSEGAARKDLDVLIEEGVFTKLKRKYVLTSNGRAVIEQLYSKEQAALSKVRLYERLGLGQSVDKPAGRKKSKANWSKVNLRAIEAAINEDNLGEICRVVGNL
ncbi:MAG: hypothetical protein WCY05_05510, partial [Candidatus Omnitrophota bacterium]